MTTYGIKHKETGLWALYSWANTIEWNDSTSWYSNNPNHERIAKGDLTFVTYMFESHPGLYNDHEIGVIDK